MAKYGSNSLVVEIDSTEGGSLADISQYVTDDVIAEVEALFEESHAFGDSWREHLATGLRQLGEITIGGIYDDTATTGPNAIFLNVQDSPADATRTLKFTWGSTKTTSVEVWIKKYIRKASRGTLHKFSAVLLPTGGTTEA